MRTRFYRLTALLLTAAMLFSGCTIGSGTSWVYSANGEQMPAGLYITYQLTAVGDAQNALAEENAGQEGFTMPTTAADLLKTTLEGKPAQQWIDEKTTEYVKLHYYIDQRFAEMGLEMTAELHLVASYTAESVWVQSGNLLEQNGISKDSYLLRSQNDIKLRRIFEELYNEGGERAPSEEELKEAFKRDYAYAEVISAVKNVEIPAGSIKTLDQLESDMKALLESYIPRLEAGEIFEDLQYEFEVAQAEINGTDKSAVTRLAPGESALMITPAESGYYRTDFLEQIMAAEVGKTSLIDLGDSFVLVKKHDLFEQEDLFSSYRFTVLSNMKYDEFIDDLLASSASVSLEVNQQAVNRYRLSNLKLS